MVHGLTLKMTFVECAKDPETTEHDEHVEERDQKGRHGPMSSNAGLRV